MSFHDDDYWEGFFDALIWFASPEVVVIALIILGVVWAFKACS